MNEIVTCCTTCQLCETRRLSEQLGRQVNPLELYYGIDSPAAEYVRHLPGLHIWDYDALKRAHEYHGRSVTLEEARALSSEEYERWKKSAQDGKPKPRRRCYNAAGEEITEQEYDL